MDKYLVVIDERFVNIEIADNDFIEATFEDNDKGSYEWFYAEGEYVIGIFNAKTEQEAINEAAESFTIDKRALKTYLLK